MDVQVRLRREASRHLPVLVWRLPRPVRAIASAPHGGGLGVRRWVVNAQV
ncbi:MAG: adenosylcobinamide amidohydrolase, partial [Actinobacteria bacterium]|nr:adenosylcobinamide amidohydrolase [Actinomycetota bacterium]